MIWACVKYRALPQGEAALLSEGEGKQGEEDEDLHLPAGPFHR